MICGAHVETIPIPALVSLLDPPQANGESVRFLQDLAVGAGPIEDCRSASPSAVGCGAVGEVSA